MARDRKRSRQRRARRPPGPDDRPVRDRAPRRDPAADGDRVPEELEGVEPELTEDDAVDSPLGEGTAAPSPLEHLSAGVDEARLAETGIPPIDAGDVEDEPRRGSRTRDRLPEDEDGVYEDELGEEAVSSSVVERSGKRERARFIAFLGHCVDELRRVQWPTRRHVGQATAVVLGFVVIAGGYLGLLDALWKPLVEAIIDL